MYNKDYQYIDYGLIEESSGISGIIIEDNNINSLQFFTYDVKLNIIYIMKTDTNTLRYKVLPTSVIIDKISNEIYGVYNTVPTTFYLMTEIFKGKIEIKNPEEDNEQGIKIQYIEDIENIILRGSLYINYTLLPGTYKTNLHFDCNYNNKYQSFYPIGIINYPELIITKAGSVKNINVSPNCIINTSSITAIREFYTISANSYNNYYNDFGIKVLGINNLHGGETPKTDFIDANMLMIPSIVSPSYIMKPVGLHISDLKNTEIFKSGSLDYFDNTDTAFVKDITYTGSIIGLESNTYYRIDIPVLQFCNSSFMERQTEIGATLSPYLVSPTTPVMMGSLEATYTNSFNQNAAIGFNNIVPNPGSNNTLLTVKTMFNKLSYTIPTIPVFCLNIAYLPIVGIFDDSFYGEIDQDWNIDKVTNTIKSPVSKYDVIKSGYFMDDDPFFRYDNNLIDGFLMVGRKYDYEVKSENNVWYVKRSLSETNIINLDYKSKEQLIENDHITKLKNGEINSASIQQGGYSKIGYPINGLLNVFNQNALVVRKNELERKLRWGPNTITGSSSDDVIYVYDINKNSVFSPDNINNVYSVTSEYFCFGKINDFLICRLLSNFEKVIKGKDPNNSDIIIPIANILPYGDINLELLNEPFVKITKNLTIFKAYTYLWNAKHIIYNATSTKGLIIVLQYIKIPCPKISFNVKGDPDKNSISKVVLNIGKDIKLDIEYKQKTETTEVLNNYSINIDVLPDTECIEYDYIEVTYKETNNNVLIPSILLEGYIIKTHTHKNILFIDLNNLNQSYIQNDNSINYIKAYKIKKFDKYNLFKINLLELNDEESLQKFTDETEPDVTINKKMINIDYFNDYKELSIFYKKYKDRIPTLLSFE